ncbi:MAG TPA: nucleoside triphosphate pyrophosphohydrolase [Anaerolineae bacterium]|nr:nucleoside triphosphate pyrophosphohydrolase [Anaerolineae bacterium]
MTITIIGLGPGDPALLTRRAWDIISRASDIYVRTARHPTLEGLPASVTVHSFDHIYEQVPQFSEVYARVAEEVLRLGGQGDVLYGVPGHPLVGEATVTTIVRRAPDWGLTVELVDGLSFIEPALAALHLDALDGLQIVDALDVAAAHHPPLDPDKPALLAQLYSRAVAGDVKLTLLNQYPPEHEVALVQAAGTRYQQVIRVPLAGIDRRDDLAHLTTLYVPPLPQPSSYTTFQETIAHLRAPEGCPWDREQTHQTLRRHLLEETYEVLEALDAGDPAALREELGDLLLQVVLQTQIAIDEEEFRMPEVIAGIDAKIKRRHPHVFGDVKVNGAEDVTRNWDAIKKAEKAAAGKAEERKSALDGIPRGLPALAEAEAIGGKAARQNFDWRSIDGVLAKVVEEVHELQHVADELEREEEFGDVLFALANVARWLKIDPEAALRAANHKFRARFREVERQAREQNRGLSELTDEELDELWNAAKRHVS